MLLSGGFDAYATNHKICNGIKIIMLQVGLAFAIQDRVTRTLFFTGWGCRLGFSEQTQ